MDEHDEHPDDLRGADGDLPQHDRLGWSHPQRQLQTSTATQCPYNLHNWGEHISGFETIHLFQCNESIHSQLYSRRTLYVDIPNNPVQTNCLLMFQVMSRHCLVGSLDSPLTFETHKSNWVYVPPPSPPAGRLSDSDSIYATIDDHLLHTGLHSSCRYEHHHRIAQHWLHCSRSQ